MEDYLFFALCSIECDKTTMVSILTPFCLNFPSNPSLVS